MRFSAANVSQKPPPNSGSYQRYAYTDAAGKSLIAAGLRQAAEPGDMEENNSSFGELVFAAEVTVEYSVQPK